jgi:hypothetical protein
MFMSFSVRTLKEKTLELGTCTSFSGFDIGVVDRAGGDAWFAMRRSGV